MTKPLVLILHSDTIDEYHLVKVKWKGKRPKLNVSWQHGILRRTTYHVCVDNGKEKWITPYETRGKHELTQSPVWTCLDSHTAFEKNVTILKTYIDCDEARVAAMLLNVASELL